jgi:uncharacterized RDD family membrane protein YckC
MAEENSAEIKYAGFWRRTAGIIPEAIVGMLLLCVLVLVHPTITPSLMNQDPYSAGNFIGSVLFWVYSTYMIGKYGATFGKMLMGIKVVSAKDHQNISFVRAFVRYMVLAISALFLLPLLVQLFTKQRQGLHDKLLGTVVIDEKNKSGGFTWLVNIVFFAVFFLYGFLLINAMEDPRVKASVMANLDQQSDIIEKPSPTTNQNQAPTTNLDNKVEIATIDDPKMQGKLFINSESIKIKENNIREASFIINGVNSLKNNAPQSEKMSAQINCNTYKISYSAYTKYKQFDTQGEAENVNKGLNTWMPISANSLQMSQYAATCGGKLKLKELENLAEYPEITLSLDPSTIQKSSDGNKIRVWYFLSLSPLGPNNKPTSYTFFTEINCQNSSSNHLLSNVYLGKNLNKWIGTDVVSKQIQGNIRIMNRARPGITSQIDTAITSSACKIN